MEHGPSTKTDAASAFLASLEEPKLTSLADAAKKPPIEILPPGMPSIDAPLPGIQRKTGPTLQGTLQPPPKPLQIEGPTAESVTAPPPAAESGAAPPPAAESGAVPDPADADGTGESRVPPPAAEAEGQPPATEPGVTVQPTAAESADTVQANAESGGTVQLTAESGAEANTTNDSGSGAVSAEPSASGVPLEAQAPVNLADAVIVGSDRSLNSTNTPALPAAEPPATQKPQVPSGVREELPMIDWT